MFDIETNSSGPHILQGLLSAQVRSQVKLGKWSDVLGRSVLGSLHFLRSQRGFFKILRLLQVRLEREKMAVTHI